MEVLDQRRGQPRPFISLSLRLQHDSPYKDGTFHFKLVLPENFPFKAPTVRLSGFPCPLRTK
jgi:hypothetical protein